MGITLRGVDRTELRLDVNAIGVTIGAGESATVVVGATFKNLADGEEIRFEEAKIRIVADIDIHRMDVVELLWMIDVPDAPGAITYMYESDVPYTDFVPSLSLRGSQIGAAGITVTH